MAINLATKFLPYVDEKFSTESKKSLLTNQDFDWTGAHTVKVYKVSTSAMNDYSRNTSDGLTGSRYGVVKDLDATTQEMTLTKDRSFTFAIDKLDTDETAQNLQAASAENIHVHIVINSLRIAEVLQRLLPKRISILKFSQQTTLWTMQRCRKRAALSLSRRMCMC